MHPKLYVISGKICFVWFHLVFRYSNTRYAPTQRWAFRRRLSYYRVLHTISVLPTAHISVPERGWRVFEPPWCIMDLFFSVCWLCIVFSRSLLSADSERNFLDECHPLSDGSCHISCVFSYHSPVVCTVSHSNVELDKSDPWPTQPARQSSRLKSNCLYCSLFR